MTASDNLSDHDMHLAELGSSDEDVEALLSSGADVDELIAAGVLDDDEPASQGDEEEEARWDEAYLTQLEADASVLSPEEIWAEFQRDQEFPV